MGFLQVLAHCVYIWRGFERDSDEVMLFMFTGGTWVLFHLVYCVTCLRESRSVLFSGTEEDGLGDGTVEEINAGTENDGKIQYSRKSDFSRARDQRPSHKGVLGKTMSLLQKTGTMLT